MEAPQPIPVSPAIAIAAFERDLLLVLQGRTLAEAGWRKLDPLTLLVPLSASRAEGGQDAFLLRLNFAYYPDFPPSALFVSPETLSYEPARDAKHLPKIEGSPEIHTHADYNGQGQLICCSNTLEFYKVRHGVEKQHLWDGKTMNFAATLNAIRRGLGSAFYKGRMG
jgi:hypothetical protein